VGELKRRTLGLRDAEGGRERGREGEREGGRERGREGEL
jgi:hypothetical protein